MGYEKMRDFFTEVSLPKIIMICGIKFLFAEND